MNPPGAPAMTPAGDQIHIAGLELPVRIGVTSKERTLPQRLTVSLTIHPRRPFDGLEDRIENTVDYSEVCQALRELAAAGRERRLIETFALEIAETVLSRFGGCAAVDVELRKYVLPDTEYVAVRLSRTAGRGATRAHLKPRANRRVV